LFWVPPRGRSIAWHSVSKHHATPIVATIAAHQKATAALMVVLKRKLRLEDNLGGKAYMTATIRMDRSGKSCRRCLARDAGRFN
jgi:hypothetical protein